MILKNLEKFHLADVTLAINCDIQNMCGETIERVRTIRNSLQIGEQNLETSLKRQEELYQGVIQLQNEKKLLDNKLETKYKAEADVNNLREEQAKKCAQLEDELLKQRKKAKSKVDKCVAKTVEASKVSEMYKKYFAMEIRKHDEHKLQIVFWNLSSKQPDWKMYFDLIIRDGQFFVTDCIPAIDNMEALLRKLNSTNGQAMQEFLRDVRHRFKCICNDSNII
jgi:chromosome segregation ATPase